MVKMTKGKKSKTPKNGGFTLDTKPLVFEGCGMFRARIVCSILSGRAIKIVKIREHDEMPGLQGE